MSTKAIEMQVANYSAKQPTMSLKRSVLESKTATALAAISNSLSAQSTVASVAFVSPPMTTTVHGSATVLARRAVLFSSGTLVCSSRLFS